MGMINNGMSYWQAETEGIELLNTTLGDLLDSRAEQIPVREAVVYSCYPEFGDALDIRWTYAEYRARVNAVAKGLIALGLNKGDHVAVGAAVSDEQLRERQASVQPRDPVQIQYTSGTTGFPKGATLHHHGILNNAMLFAHRWGLYQGDRYCNPLPFFHTGGCVLAALGTVSAGSMLHPLLAFDPLKALQSIGQERCTTLLGVPTMLLAMLHHPDFPTYDLSSLRTVLTGGTPVPIYLMEQVKERMGADVNIVFGQTEAGTLITQTLPDDPFERKAATVGVPLPHSEVKVINPATGDIVPCGERGEICCRGYQVMAGYYQMPEKTAETIDSDGWLHTGDLATMDAQGYVNIVGRLKDMVIRGGE